MPQDDLTPLEQRLAECHPAATGLDADAMLFAAGRAAAMRAAGPRWPWPAATCCFAVLSLALTAALVGEHSERRALAARLDRLAVLAMSQPGQIPDLSAPAPDSYLAARRSIESGTVESFARSDPSSFSPVPPDDTPVLRAWSSELEP
jgi:hypothetical protein